MELQVLHMVLVLGDKVFLFEREASEAEMV